MAAQESGASDECFDIDGRSTGSPVLGELSRSGR